MRLRRGSKVQLACGQFKVQMRFARSKVQLACGAVQLACGQLAQGARVIITYYLLPITYNL